MPAPRLDVSAPARSSREAKSHAESRCVRVALERAIGGLDRELTYSLPPDLNVEIGHAIAVPLRANRAVGYVTALLDKPDCDSVRPVEARLGDEPLFDEFALKIARWMSAYYHVSLAECLALWIASGATPGVESKYEFIAPEPLRALRDLARTPKLFAIAKAIFDAKKALSPREIDKKVDVSATGDQLRRLCEIGVLSERLDAPRADVRAKLVASVQLNESGREVLNGPEIEKLERKAPKQALALRTVAELNQNNEWLPVSALTSEGTFDSSALRTLNKKGLLDWEQIESLRLPQTLVKSTAPRVQLTDEQANAVQQIGAALEEASFGPEKNGDPHTVLLQGVTASGKTEVYLSAIEKCLQMNRRALVLVPEIALTAQTVEIFGRRFGSSVAILHSALSAGERFDEWRRAGRGDAQIVVGARSAVFAPVRNVGLIIVDEEHDGSYKQDKVPRYHAREIAARRAALDGSVVVLGSATPSLESYARATRGEYRHVLMHRRATGRPLPEVEIVDMTNEARGGTLPVLSSRLKDELCETVARSEQAILFLNRRGFATYVQCLGCGHAEKCPNCDVSLTHHKGENTLRCHHCDHCVPTPGRCPKCDGWMLAFNGSGTEKVAEQVEELLRDRGLEEQRVLRLDRDTTTTKGSHASILGDFRSGGASVLIGTQMVTKGLDFPRVTLVGVISADTALNVPDFRASERTFQLLAQVAGRAGRGQVPGRVLIQTLAADDIAITTAATHDFKTFVEQELEARAQIPNPPYSHVVNIVSSDPEEHIARIRLERLAVKFQDAIAHEGGATDLLGPVSCPLARVKNKFRFHILLRDKSKPRLHRVLARYDELAREDKEGLTVDVDALTIL